MADFVQSANVKNAVRTLAEPIADVATFNMIIQSVIDDNPFECVSYLTGGVTHDPGKAGKRSPLLTVSNIDTNFSRELDSCVMSVMQPSEIYFSPYSNGEMEAILRDMIRQGIYSGVISPEVFDLIIGWTLSCGDIRVGLDLIRRAVLNAERNARKIVGPGDVESAFDIAKNIHLVNSVKVLNKEKRKLLGTTAKYSQQEEHMMHSGAVFASVREESPMGYTTFFERLKKFDEMRLINLTSRRIGGNTKEISLRYDAEKVVEECGG